MKLRDFRIGWRLLIQQPFQSAVELLGLATAFAVCFLLLGFMAYSFSYAVSYTHLTLPTKA